VNKPVIGFENVGTGFADPVADAQAVFRCILNATAHPGRIVEIPEALLANNDEGLSGAATAVALTLLDFETPVWLDAALAPAGDFLRFHCGVPLAASPTESRFAFAVDTTRLPELTQFDLGTPDFPERSTTLVIEVPDIAAEPGLRLRGPGIQTSVPLRIDAISNTFWMKRAELAELFPLGIDLIFTCGRRLCVLPRTTNVEI
jgi:alpha-D-ribose 1-methylphosphonate 5-triphosphate synthase subunit PhnH